MAEEQAQEAPKTANDLAKMADLYHVPMSHDTLKAMADDKGEVSPEKHAAFEDYLKTTAQGLFPSFAKQIASGIPTSHLLDPYRHVAKMQLGEHVEPNFHDPMWEPAITGGRDKDGRPVPMSLAEWKAHLRGDPRYGFHDTLEGQRMMGNAIEALRQGLEAH